MHDIDVLHFDLLRRVGTVRSRLALIERFCARVELHDRRRLAAIIETTADTRQIEHRLRDELALYLFDAGLNPLTEVPFGVVRTDIFDPSAGPAFVVEAKQYEEGASLERKVVDAFRQTLDTAQRLHPPYEADEVYIVFFRRGGPHAEFPRDALLAGGRRYYLRLADLAPAAVTGSRQRAQPVRFTVDALDGLYRDAESLDRVDGEPNAEPKNGGAS